MIQNKMDFSMNIKVILSLIAAGTLAACTTSGPRGDWGAQYGTAPAGAPTQMMYGTPPDDGTTRRMSVLLPLSGDNAATGRAIRTGIEAAILARAPQNMSVTFYDTGRDTTSAINSALSENPEIIIGPVFANDARMLRSMKPDDMPAISFTSDATAVGDGVMTMALMPTNSVELIVREMSADKSRGMLIMAPDTNSGRLMAGAARAAATEYDIPVSGVTYYHEGNTDSIKDAALRASLYTARNAANTRAREILSDVATNERLTAIEKSSVMRQLDAISRVETLGRLPYDAILMLGSGNDAKSLASFMRYYGVGTRDAQFYGTAMWDGSNATTDFTLTGAKYAALPETSPQFAATYTEITGAAPSRIAGFGYDAANLAMGMMYSGKSAPEYLMAPGGYIGIDGLVRMTPSGASQRGLRIMQASPDAPRVLRNAPKDFMTPIYTIDARQISPAREMAVETPGINAMTYIQIPDRVRGKYKSKTYGANMTTTPPITEQNVVTILPEDDGDAVIENPDFKSAAAERVSRTYIDSVEING